MKWWKLCEDGDSQGHSRDSGRYSSQISGYLADTLQTNLDIWEIQLREVRISGKYSAEISGYLADTACGGPDIWEIIGEDIIVESDGFRDISLFEKYSSNKPN